MLKKDMYFKDQRSLKLVDQTNLVAKDALKDPSLTDSHQSDFEKEPFVNPKDVVLSSLAGMVIAMFLFTSVGDSWRRLFFIGLDWLPGERWLKLGVLAFALVAVVLAFVLQRHKQLQKSKQLLYDQSLEHHLALQAAMKAEKNAGATKKRLDYLGGIDSLLKIIIADLTYDLGIVDKQES